MSRRTGPIQEATTSLLMQSMPALRKTDSGWAVTPGGTKARPARCLLRSHRQGRRGGTAV